MDDSIEMVSAVAEVVVLQETSTGVVPAEGRSRVDLNDETPLPIDLIVQCLDSCVRLIAPMDVPYGLVDAVKRRPVPSAFAATSQLSRQRALVFRDGECLVEGYRLRYSRLFGVLVDDLPDAG
ncbi:hypothetical protein [Herbidospora sp. RD11066]